MSSATSRGKNYSQQEALGLLVLVGHVLPICSMEWEKVLEDHNELWPSRTIDSIRKKFQKLSKAHMGTGETDCPEEIIEAKRIHMEIVKRAEVDTCEDEYSEDFSANAVLDESIPMIPSLIGNVQPTESSGRQPSTPVRLNNHNSQNPNFQCSIVSPKLQRISRKRKNDDDLNLNDIFKMQLLQQQEERKDRIERERIREERERVREERREANERMWQNMMMASFASFMPKTDNSENTGK